MRLPVIYATSKTRGIFLSIWFLIPVLLAIIGWVARIIAGLIRAHL